MASAVPVLCLICISYHVSLIVAQATLLVYLLHMEAHPFEKYRKYAKYLPSGKFVKVMALCIGGALLILLVTSLAGSKGTFDANGLFSQGATVSDLVTQDSNKNGIPDWEESLWGFDPKGDGEANKKAIEARKAENRRAAGLTEEPSTPVTATDELSRSLLSTILALQQSGTLTQEALTNLAASLGDNVDAVHAEVPTYTQADLTISDAPKAKQAYANAMRDMASDYEDLGFGSELGIIGLSFDTENEVLLGKLDPIADGYIDFGKRLLKLSTPREAAVYAVALANASVRMGVYLKQVEKLPDDVLTGMVGLNDYIEASKLSDQAAESLKAYFGL